MARKHGKSQFNFLNKPVTESQMTEAVRGTMCHVRDRLLSDIQHSFPGPSLKTRRRVKSHKTNCHLTVQKFPFSFEGILKLCRFPPMKKSACYGSFFMGSKIYLKIYSNYIISCNLGFCSWQTCYESDRAYPIHFFVIKASQIWPWLLSVSIFNWEVRIATLNICQNIPRGP